MRIIVLLTPFEEWASQVLLMVKKSACQYRKHKRHRFDPWVGKIPWRMAVWVPIFLLENPMDREAWWATVHGVAKSTHTQNDNNSLK